MQDMIAAFDEYAALTNKRKRKPMPRNGLSTAAIKAHVAARVREARTLHGLTQKQLGTAIGLTAQQIYKYERGLNSIHASELYKLACLFNVAIDFFFDHIGANQCSSETCSSLTAELILNFSAVRDEKHREAFSQMVRALATTAVREP